MHPLAQALQQYARHHRDGRNTLTHFIGVPMVWLGISILLGQPAFWIGRAVLVNPAMLLTLALALLYYRRLGWLVGVCMALLLLLVNVVGLVIVSSFDPALQWGTVLLTLGAMVQMLGHLWEGNKPAFLDDWRSVFLSPLYLVCVVLFAFGLCKRLKAQMVQVAGSASPLGQPDGIPHP